MKVVRFRLLIEVETPKGNIISYSHDGKPLPDANEIKAIFREAEKAVLAHCSSGGLL